MKKRVAIFPAGTEIGLEIHRSLMYSTHFDVIGFSSVGDHSKFVYKQLVEGLPYFHEEGFIDSLNYYLEEYNIDFLYPAHDDVQLFLTENLDKIKVQVITTELNTVRICRSKLETYKFFEEEQFTPKVYNEEEYPNYYPVFSKPDIGQGAKGVKVLNNEEEFKLALENEKKLAITEFLPGEEYTIDCFTDYNGSLLKAIFRNRNRIKTGISVNSKILPIDERVQNIANKINNNLTFNGAWFFQLKIDNNDEFKLMEIAPRVSGTMGISRNTGINFPLLSIFNQLKYPVKKIENEYSIEVDRAFISRYKLNIEYSTVYLDLDDALIINNQVNHYLMMFIFQTLNLGKKIILISKHEKDILETLMKFKISKDIFDEIIHVSKSDDKAKYMKHSDAIFIDDSFAERINVSQKIGIPVFDCSEVESLIDWRM